MKAAAAVDFTTLDDTAAAGFDYTATNGTLTFGNGETSKTFDISIISDALGEGEMMEVWSNGLQTWMAY